MPKFQQIGMFQLIKNMLSPRTLPHIAMIAILSTILLFLVRSQEVFVAISFISLAFSYLIVAALSNVEIVKNLTKLPEEKMIQNGLFGSYSAYVLQLFLF